MIGSLLLIAQAPLFFLLASPQRPWWIAGASVMWIAWVGLNIGQPNLMLKLCAPADQHAVYRPVVQRHRAVLCRQHGPGRAALRPLWRCQFRLLGRFVLDYYHLAFLLAWVFRSLGVLVLIWLVVEPGVEGKKGGKL